MTAELAGKTALVTGAASGIGAACAIELASAGAIVVLADRAGMDDTLKAIETAGGSARTVACDVADSDSVSALFRAIGEDPGGLDIAVNCAGVLVECGLLDMSVEEFDRIVGVNLRGTFLIARGAIAMMRAKGAGRMITVASELAYLGRAEFSAYCATKAGVIGMTRSLAREFAPDILVNAVAPGPVDTPMLSLESMSPEWREKETDIPMGRVGKAEEIAAVVRFLAGPGASFMTGQTVSPNGGAVMF